MSDGNPRRVRVAQSMRQSLAEMIEREVKDPRVREAGLLSVNHVELNADMSVARVHVSFIGSGDSRKQAVAIAGLDAAARFLRGPVARSLGLRRAPELRFVQDDSTAFQQRVVDIVRGDSEARARSGEPDTTDDEPDKPERG